MRDWDGTLFLRQGWYRGGVFRFTLSFLDAYPNECPIVKFTHPIPPHPLIHPETGVLDIQNEFPNWNPKEFCSLHVIGYIKRIFYEKDVFVSTPDCPNPQIRQLFQSSPSQFLSTVEHSIQESFSQASCRALAQGFLPFSESPDVPSPKVCIPDDQTTPDSIDDHRQNQLNTIARALQAFSNESQSSVNPKDAFLDWFSEEYLADLDLSSSAAQSPATSPSTSRETSPKKHRTKKKPKE